MHGVGERQFKGAEEGEGYRKVGFGHRKKTEMGRED